MLRKGMAGHRLLIAPIRGLVLPADLFQENMYFIYAVFAGLLITVGFGKIYALPQL